MSEFNIKFRSTYLSATIGITIITPNPGADEDPGAFYDRTFPVLWALHGGYSGFAD